MDSAGKLIWAKNNEIVSATIKLGQWDFQGGVEKAD